MQKRANFGKSGMVAVAPESGRLNHDGAVYMALANRNNGAAVSLKDAQIIDVICEMTEIVSGGFAKDKAGKSVRTVNGAKPTAENPGAGNTWQPTYRTKINKTTEYADGTTRTVALFYADNVGIYDTGDDVADLRNFIAKGKEMAAIGAAIVDYCENELAALIKTTPKQSTPKQTVRQIAQQDIDDDDESEGEDIAI